MQQRKPTALKKADGTESGQTADDLKNMGEGFYLTTVTAQMQVAIQQMCRSL